MALFNTLYVIEEYKSDLGLTFKNLPVKIQSNAPVLDKLYKARPTGVCRFDKTFTPRRLEVVFESGKNLLYPVPSLAAIPDFLKELKDANVGGQCVNLLGEEWGMVPRSIAIPTGSTKKKIPYGSIKRSSIGYDYISDVLGEVKLSTPMESTKGIDNAKVGDLPAILECQKKGMKAAVEDADICRGGSDIRPRRFNLSIGLINEQNKRGWSITTRQAIVSSNAKDLLTTTYDDFQPSAIAPKLVDCTRCIGYSGETMFNIDMHYDLSNKGGGGG